MATYYTVDTDLISIASAIREKGETSASLSFPTGFVNAINSISLGGPVISYFYNDAYEFPSIFQNNNTTSIRAGAFNASPIQSVSFANCVTIGFKAFNECYSLRSINFPKCTTLESYAFCSCESLTTISLPKCTTIGDRAFYKCFYISYSFPECLTIGKYAFAYAASYNTSATFFAPKCSCVASSAFYGADFKIIDLPLCQHVSSNAFGYCGTSETTINLPKCTYVERDAFMSCKVKSITLPLCETVESSAFMGCTNLVTLSLPNCTSLSRYAFSGCRMLESIYLGPLSSAEFWFDAFLNCNNLKYFTCLASSFYVNGAALWLTGSQVFELFELPNCTTASYIFGGSIGGVKVKILSLPVCTELGSGTVTSTSGVESVYAPMAQILRTYCFSWATISNIYAPNCQTVETDAFLYGKITGEIHIEGCKTIGSSAFWETNLSSISLPNCEIIGSSAFYNNSFLTLSLPKCSMIYSYAFKACPLKSLYITNSVFATLEYYGLDGITESSFRIYVPSSMLASYKTRTNWTRYSSRMVGI